MKNDKLKVLVSACLMGESVRWNGANKRSGDLISWAANNDIELIPVCPENELYGTPRSTIGLVYIDEKVQAKMAGRDVSVELSEKCQEIRERHPDAVGFIGIYGSPTCGISVPVKKFGKVTKGYMHDQALFPTVEVGQLKSCSQRETFIRRIKKSLQLRAKK